MHETQLQCTAWAQIALMDTKPWWPVYIADPNVLTTDELLSLGGAPLVDTAKSTTPSDVVVFYFGLRTWHLRERDDATLQRWQCRDHWQFLQGAPSAAMDVSSVWENFVEAMDDVENYLSVDQSQRTLPRSAEAAAPPLPSPSTPTHDTHHGSPQQPAECPNTVPRPLATFGTVAWSKLAGRPWLPVFVVDPANIPLELRPLSEFQSQVVDNATCNSLDHRLVYYFGYHNLGLIPVHALRAWKGPEHAEFLAGCRPTQVSTVQSAATVVATAEAEEFLRSNPNTRQLPLPCSWSNQSTDGSATPILDATVKSDIPSEHGSAPPGDTATNDANAVEEQPSTSPTLTAPFAAGSVVWTFTTGEGWIPAIVCDPAQVQTALPNLTGWYKTLLRKAMDHPADYVVVYLFGPRTLGLRNTHDDVVKCWECPEHVTYVQGDASLDFSNQRQASFRQAIETAKTVAAGDASATLSFIQICDKDDETSEKAATTETSRPLVGNDTIPPPTGPSDPPTKATYPPDVTLKCHQPASPPDHLKKPRPNDAITAVDDVIDLSEEASSNDPSFLQKSKFVPSASLSCSAKARRVHAGDDGGIPFRSLAWVRSRTGYMWWPAYICDPDDTPHQLHSMGYCLLYSVAKAKQYRTALRLVLSFGRHTISLHEVATDLKRWECPEHDALCRVHENPPPQQIIAAKLFAAALKEALDWAASTRAPTATPFMLLNAIKSAMSRPPTTVGYGAKAWAMTASSIWFPACVLHPLKLPPELKDWERTHGDLVVLVKTHPCENRLVYVFGLHELGVRNVKTELVSWQGDNPNLAKGRKDVAFSKTYVDVGHQLTRAQLEMNAYFGTDEATRRLPMLGSVAVPAQPMQPVATSTDVVVVPWNSLGWVKIYLSWWPVYVCDPTCVRPTLHILGAVDMQMLRHATATPDKCRLVYYFGLYTLGLATTKSVKRWNCPDQDALANRMLEVQDGQTSTRALQEANEYAGADKATRLLPYMVASDLNPLEDPPPLSLVWHFRLDSVWAPGLVYDPKQPWPQAFGRPPDNMLAALKSVRNPYHVVFNFGYRDYSMVRAHAKCIVPYRCPMHAKFVAAISSLENEDVRSKLLAALQEVEAFTAMDSPVPGAMDSPPPSLHVESPSGVPNPATNNTLPDQVTAPSYPIRTSSAIEPAMTLLVEAPVPHAFAVNDTLSTVHAAQRVEEAEDQSTIRTSDDDGRPTKSDAIGQDDDGAAEPSHSQYDLVDCIGWARAPKLPWWPVYICDPDHIPEDLKLLAPSQQLYQPQWATRKDPAKRRLVFYFGRNIFGSALRCQVMPWEYSANDAVLGHMSFETEQNLHGAVVLAQNYAAKHHGRTREGAAQGPHDAATHNNQQPPAPQKRIQATSPAAHASTTDAPPAIAAAAEAPPQHAHAVTLSTPIADPHGLLSYYDHVMWMNHQHVWRPVYVVNPDKPPLHFPSTDLVGPHRTVLPVHHQDGRPLLVVYCFGLHTVTTCEKGWLAPWLCAERREFVRIGGASVAIALQEANDFLARGKVFRLQRSTMSKRPSQHGLVHNIPPHAAGTHPSERRLPRQPPSPVLPTGVHPPAAPPTPPAPVLRSKVPAVDSGRSFTPPCHSVAWGILRGFPWLPVYILDALTLKPDLHHLGDGHVSILEQARQHPSWRIVYYFGTHDFGIHPDPSATLKPWNCPESDKFANGFPKEKCKKHRIRVELEVAVKEARTFLSSHLDDRLLPYMVRSDYLDLAATEDEDADPPSSEREDVDTHLPSPSDEEASDDGDDSERDDEYADTTQGTKNNNKRGFRTVGKSRIPAKRRPSQHTWHNLVRLKRHATNLWTIQGPPYRRPTSRQRACDTEAPLACDTVAPLATIPTSMNHDAVSEETIRLFQTTPPRSSIAHTLAPLDSTPEANPPDHVKPALLPSQRVAWVLLQDAIWWPVLVCGSFFQDENPDKGGHLVEAVHLYYFGTHTYAEHICANIQLAAWNGPDHGTLLENPAIGEHFVQRVMDDFKRSIAEAEDFYCTHKTMLDRDALYASVKSLAPSSDAMSKAKSNAPNQVKRESPSKPTSRVVHRNELDDPEFDAFFR